MVVSKSAPRRAIWSSSSADKPCPSGWVVQAGTNSQRPRLTPLGKMEIPSDKSLQFWTKGDDWKGPVSLGLVKPGQSLEVPLNKLPQLQPNPLFEITLEPYNGSPSIDLRARFCLLGARSRLFSQADA